MVSNVISIQLIQNRSRWDFASYNPSYESALKAIRESSHAYYSLVELVASFKYGASIPADYVDQGILFIRAQNIREHGVDLSDTRYVSEDTPGLEGHFVETGDILITRSGINVGDAVSIPPSLTGGAHGSYSIRLRLKNEAVSPEYLAIVINSPVVRAQIKAFKGRSAQPNINIAELSRLQILLPPRPTQDRIAQVMQEAYAARREKLAEVEKLLSGIEAFVFAELGIDIAAFQKRRAIIKPIREIAGGRFDFEAVAATQHINFNGTEPTLLKDVVQQVNERILPAEEYPDEDVNYISLGNIASNTGELAEFEPVKGSTVLSSSPKFQRGDILFGRMRPYLNKVWIAEFDGICTGEAIVLRPNNKKVGTQFLHALLLSQLTLIQVVPLQSGTSLPRVSATDILNVKLPIPHDLKRQEQIGEEVARRRTEAKRLRAEAEQVVVEAKARVERMILGEEG
jgi:restriction endonuclease S subunit